MSKRLTRLVFILFILLAWTLPGLTGGATASSPVDLIAASYLSSTLNESSPLTCSDDMLGYWKLDELEGTTFQDYFAGNDGACTDKCPQAAEGIVNGAQEFAGAQEIHVPSSEAFNWTAGDSFSIELWVNPAQGLEPGQGIFISRHALTPAWWVGYEQVSGVTIFALRDSAGVGIEMWAETAVNDGNWHHVVAVHDADRDEILLFVDGVLDKAAPITFMGNWISDRYLGIGFHNNAYGDPIAHYTGRLDEIAIYGKALSLDEVQYHYNQGLQGEDYCEAVDLTVNIVGSGSVTEYPAAPYKYGQEVSLTAVPEPGFIFYDWSGDLTGFDNPATITMDGDKVITASFCKPVWYTLAVETTGEGAVLVEPELEEYLHGSRVTLTAVPQPGWRFTGWSGDLAGDDNPVDLVMTADKNVIATFSVPKIFLPLSLK